MTRFKAPEAHVSGSGKPPRARLGERPGMSSGTNKRRKLRDGDAVLLQRESGERLKGLVVGIDDEAVDVVLRGDIGPGELLQISRSVRDDARYEALMEVVRTAPGRSRVRLVGDWQRVQMREFVRVSVYGIPMEVLAEELCDSGGGEDPRERLLRHRDEAPVDDRPPLLLDLSAGGLRFESRETLRLGDTLTLEFSLPSKGPVSVRGEVVRASLAPEPADDSRDTKGPNQYGVRFLHMDESVRVKIMGWVFSEQARRFRVAKRRDGAS